MRPRRKGEHLAVLLRLKRPVRDLGAFVATTQDLLPMSTIETVVRASQRLERALESIGGRGSGLGEKAKSLSGVLDAGTLRRLWRIAQQRNKVVHEPNADIGDLSAFRAEVASLVKALRKAAAPSARAPGTGMPKVRRATRARRQRRTSRAERTLRPAPRKPPLPWTLVALAIVVAVSVAAAVLAWRVTR